MGSRLKDAVINAGKRGSCASPVVFFHSAPSTEDRMRLVAALNAGQAASTQLDMRPADGEHRVWESAG
ncbi:hypothetical protein [Streptomyces sp. NPDC050534]|uniref:hypothetical protein n=1 Tax=Streptomyces sp. NPDC050534 TaxID=3365625 RepID=UPI0037ACFCAB